MRIGTVKSFFTFLLFGPFSSLLSLICLLLLMVVVGLPSSGRGSGSSIGDLFRNIFPNLGLGLMIVYVMGGMQAAFVGLISAWWYHRKGRLPLLVPLLSALLACAVFITIMEGRAWYFSIFVHTGTERSFWKELENPLFYLFLHAALAFWPWLLLRTYLRTKDDPHYP